MCVHCVSLLHIYNYIIYKVHKTILFVGSFGGILLTNVLTNFFSYVQIIDTDVNTSFYLLHVKYSICSLVHERCRKLVCICGILYDI